MPSNYTRRLTSIRVKIEIKEGRVSVSGREYFADHVYIVGFDNGSVVIDNEGFNIEMNYRSMPRVYTEGSLVKIGDILSTVIIDNPVIRKIEEKGDEVIVFMDNVDLKIRQDNGSIKVVVEGVKEYSVSNVDVDIACMSGSIANVLTRPFLSIWIYCDGSHKLLIRKGKDSIKISIRRK